MVLPRTRRPFSRCHAGDEDAAGQRRRASGSEAADEGERQQLGSKGGLDFPPSFVLEVGRIVHLAAKGLS